MAVKVKYEDKVVRISVEDKLKCVILTWLEVPTSAEFRDSLTTGLEVVKHFRLSRWIGDVRNLGAIEETDQHWSTNIWFPLALNAGINKMAIILSDDLFNQLSVEEIMHRVSSPHLVSHYFSDQEEALSWIR